MPPSAPCAAATRMLPFTVARITVANLRDQVLRLLVGVERESRRRCVRASAAAVAQQEEREVQRDEEADDEVERVLADVEHLLGDCLAAGGCAAGDLFL